MYLALDQNIIVSDETDFWKSSFVNKQNRCYWYKKNLREMPLHRENFTVLWYNAATVLWV